MPSVTAARLWPPGVKEEGIHQEAIIPMTVPQKKGDPLVVTQDETFRPGTTLEALAKLNGTDPMLWI